MAATHPDWLREGAEVAVTTGGAYGHTQFATIERITDEKIELFDGRTYSPTPGYRQIDERALQDTRLADPADMRIIDAYAREQLRMFAMDANTYVRGAYDAPIHSMHADDVARALRHLAGKLDAARGVVAERLRRAR